MEGRVVSLDEIEIEDLPSREGFVNMLPSVLRAPIRNFARRQSGRRQRERGPVRSELPTPP